MSKEALVIFLGAFIGILPFLGLPGSWRTALLCISGLVVVLLGVLLRREAIARGDTKGAAFFIDNRGSDISKPFEESKPAERIQ